MNYTLRFADNIYNWNKALKEIMSMPAYREFFALTSKRSPVVVENVPTFRDPPTAEWCHMLSQRAENDKHARRVSGWYVICDNIFSESPPGVCRLTNHSNIMLGNGILYNPVGDFGLSHHIFIPDDKRIYDLASQVGYNDRVFFTDEYLGGDKFYGNHTVERNSVYFARNSYIDNHPDAEQYETFYSVKEMLNSIPDDESHEATARRIQMRSKVYISDEEARQI